MEPFTIHRGKVAVLDRANVDTDQIIPKQFLKSIKRTGFGESLFFDWRYNEDGGNNPDFPLNAEIHRGASVLVTGNNFGCGSSREHAVWAVQQYGFRAVIAPRKKTDSGEIPGFADIFRNNCGKNGVLTIELSEAEVDEIQSIVKENPGIEAEIVLPDQKIRIADKIFTFSIDSGTKERLLNGLDEIGLTLNHKQAIDTFERTRRDPIQNT